MNEFVETDDESTPNSSYDISILLNYYKEIIPISFLSLTFLEVWVLVDWRTANLVEVSQQELSPPNIVFMSDGFIGVDRNLIAEVKADGVNITAFGFTPAGMDTMRLVDPDAIYINNPQEIIDVFSGFDPRYLAEPLMEGVTVYLDLNNNGLLDQDEPNQVTRRDDSSSRLGRNNYTFTFDNLLLGTYTVRQIIPHGFSQTAPQSDSFVLVSSFLKIDISDKVCKLI